MTNEPVTTGDMATFTTFASWCDQQPHGVLSRISREAGIGYTTVRKLYTGHSAALRTARKVSAATGGAITVEQLQAGCR